MEPPANDHHLELPYSKFVQCIDFQKEEVRVSLPKGLGTEFGKFMRLQLRIGTVRCPAVWLGKTDPHQITIWVTRLCDFGRVHGWLLRKERGNVGEIDWQHWTASEIADMHEEDARVRDQATSTLSAHMAYYEERGVSPTPSALAEWVESKT